MYCTIFIVVMKILIFNASPRKERGTTDILLNTFIEGASESDAEITKHYVVDLNINGCLGCFTCWWKTPGKCVHRDDMDWILPEIADADVLVFGTPIYGSNVTHYLWRLIERTFTFSMPEMHIGEEGETRHPSRQRKIPKGVLVATCGFPDSTPFRLAKALFQSTLHITLPAAQLLFNEEERTQLAEFLETIRVVGKMMTNEQDVTEALREKLCVEFSEEKKKQIVEAHNIYSASRLDT